MKTCSKCGETKEKSEFGNYARSPDGLNSGCKKCRNANSLNYKRLRTPEKILLERQEKEAAENRLNRGLKICFCCKEEKPLLDFASGARKGRYSYCRSCSKTKSAKTYSLNKEKTLIRMRARKSTHPREGLDARRRRLFGVSPEDFDQIVLNQEGKCAICREPFIKTPHLDHDHSSGKIRGVLCLTCNPGLGLFKDSPERLRAAADYLEGI